MSGTRCIRCMGPFSAKYYGICTSDVFCIPGIVTVFIKTTTRPILTFIFSFLLLSFAFLCFCIVQCLFYFIIVLFTLGFTLVVALYSTCCTFLPPFLPSFISIFQVYFGDRCRFDVLGCMCLPFDHDRVGARGRNSTYDDQSINQIIT